MDTTSVKYRLCDVDNEDGKCRFIGGTKTTVNDTSEIGPLSRYTDFNWFYPAGYFHCLTTDHFIDYSADYSAAIWGERERGSSTYEMLLYELTLPGVEWGVYTGGDGGRGVCVLEVR